MLLIGVDKFTDWGPPRETKHGRFTPIDNCFEYKSFGYNPCDSGFVIGEYFEDEDVDIKLVSDIKDENYIYPVFFLKHDTSSKYDFFCCTSILRGLLRSTPTISLMVAGPLDNTITSSER